MAKDAPKSDITLFKALVRNDPRILQFLVRAWIEKENEKSK